MPDVILETRISANQAQIYRLSGDYNALHIDPSAAFWDSGHAMVYVRAGHVANMLLSAFARGKALFRKLKVRFSAPVYPGDTRSPRLARWRWSRLFEAYVGEAVVINNAYFEYQAPSDTCLVRSANVICFGEALWDVLSSMRSVGGDH